LFTEQPIVDKLLFSRFL